MSYYEIIGRLIIGVIVGGIIGYERQHKNRPAGLRTHILVCLGATIISMVQQHSFAEALSLITKDPTMVNVIKVDMGRLGAQVITGVGFLGAGTIMHEKGSIKGLTTAATIWVVACIGLGVGLGYYFLSISSTIVVYVVLVMLKKFEVKYMGYSEEVTLRIEHDKDVTTPYSIAKYFSEKNIKVLNVSFDLDEDDYKTISEYTIVLKKNINAVKIVEELNKYSECVYSVRIN